MENAKLPIALVAAMALQLSGGVWWVSQQAATISGLEETVSELGSRMAIENNINLQRDVEENAREIINLWNEADDIWKEHDQLTGTISAITALQQRIALLETEIKYMNRDHDTVLDRKGGMK